MKDRETWTGANPTIEGLRLARDQIYKQLLKERQRSKSFQDHCVKLAEEIIHLKEQLKKFQ